MNTCDVPHCDRPVADAAVCGACAGLLERDLGNVPGLVDELWTVIGRQSRYADTNGSATGDPRLLTNRYVGTLLGSLRNTLATWVRVVVEERGARPPLARPERLATMPATEWPGPPVQRLTEPLRRCPLSDLPTTDCHHCREDV